MADLKPREVTFAHFKWMADGPMLSPGDIVRIAKNAISVSKVRRDIDDEILKAKRLGFGQRYEYRIAFTDAREYLTKLLSDVAA
jgi:hypothetical protein